MLRLQISFIKKIFFKEKTHKIKLQLQNQSPIKKILWSSFDYTSGPGLEFTWEADYDDFNIHVFANTSDENETIDGNQSTDSSLSKVSFLALSSMRNFQNTNESINTMARDQYEDIDEVFNVFILQIYYYLFQSELITTRYNFSEFPIEEIDQVILEII